MILFFNDLIVPDDIFKITKPVAHLLNLNQLRPLLKTRPQNSHKGDYGHVLVIGGNYGFTGAIAGDINCSLRVGAGLCSVITHPGHIGAYISRQPEIMTRGISILIKPCH